jgi:hypothetical protein
LCDICHASLGYFGLNAEVSMFPSFPRYKEGTGGRRQIEPGPPVLFIVLFGEGYFRCGRKTSKVPTRVKPAE